MSHADNRHLIHRDGLPSERAALQVVEPTITPMREQIMRDLQTAGESGLTPDEWAATHHGLINTVRRRFTDLWKDGLIRHHPNGAMRKNAAENLCVVWVLGEDKAGRTTREQSMRERIKELETENAQQIRELEQLRAKHGLLL